ncbi:MAG: hypothetical protein Q4F88_01790 [Eubacteriales bacterium]|nr:hypothetical protein [Eubacteriales bacterium]
MNKKILNQKIYKYITFILALFVCVIFLSNITFSTELDQTKITEAYDENGNVVKDALVEHNGNYYYFDQMGVLAKEKWVQIDSSLVHTNQDVIPEKFWYYFQSNGKAMKANQGESFHKKKVNGKTFLFNEYGQMLFGYIDVDGIIHSPITDEETFMKAMYYAGEENDGALKSGWVKYTNDTNIESYQSKNYFWLYFDLNNFKKIYYDGTEDNKYREKKIDDKTYSFDKNGVMHTGWSSVKVGTGSSSHYVSVGGAHLKKKTWFYAVPTEKADKASFDDNALRWFYKDNSGAVVKNGIKRINNAYYAFDENGIMRAGLILFDYMGRYVAKVSLERTDVSDITVLKRFFTENFVTGSDDYLEISLETGDYFLYFEGENIYHIDLNEYRKSYIASKNEIDKGVIHPQNTNVNLAEPHYNLGKEKNGLVTISFQDRDVYFNSNKQGGYDGYVSKEKKIYDNGILLQADKDLKYGIAYATSSTPSKDIDYKDPIIVSYKTSDIEEYPLFVVDTNGKRITGYECKKDGFGNYWIISDNYFMKVVDIPVKFDNSKGYMFKSEFYTDDTKTKIVSKYMPFYELDIHGNTVTLERNEKKGAYDLDVNTFGEEYCLNFQFAEHQFKKY